jgi:DNA-binding transcriptional LysR family regulator
MDVEKYKALVSAIDCGTISRTAEQMGYTVSAVSRMVASLEEEHGFPLLIRSKADRQRLYKHRDTAGYSGIVSAVINRRKDCLL